jgi:hypothetical protein
LAVSSKLNEEHDDDSAAEFIAFDHSTYEWTFRVPHFTKWGIDADERRKIAKSKIYLHQDRCHQVRSTLSSMLTLTNWKKKKSKMMERMLLSKI